MFDTDIVLHLEDLKRRWDFAENPLAVFGKPIAHSLSPAMQNAALRKLAQSEGQFASWKYYKFEIDPENLEKTLSEFHKADFAGINLTIPHKEIVMPFLREISPFAQMVGAANTLIRTKGGWKGDNTDGFGVAWAVENFSGRVFKNSDVVILGAGGASRAAAFKALVDGCKSLRIYNRTKSRLEKLLSDISACGFSAEPLDCFSKIEPNSIIINASSVGLKTDDRPILDFAKVPNGCVYFDMPYIRSRETNAVLKARKYGFKAASGLAMLASQGALSLSLWTSRPLQIETMLEALKNA